MHAIAPSVSSGHVRLHSARPRPPRPRAEARQRTTKTLPTRQRRRRHDALSRRERQRAEVQDAHCVRNSRQEQIRETRAVREVRPCISGRGGWSDECGTKIIYYGGEDSPRCAISPGLCPHSGGRRSKRHERTPRRGPCQSPHTSRAVGAVPYPLTELMTALSLWRSARGCKAAPSCAARGRGGARRCAGPRP